MTIQPVSQPISPLCQPMLEDMAVRRLRQGTQRDHVHSVLNLVTFLKRSPNPVTVEDSRRFQVPQAESGVQPPSINCSVSALRFFFTMALDRPDLSCRFIIVRHPQKLPTLLSVEEVGRLLAIAPWLKHRAAFGIACRAGLRVSEAAALKVGAINSTRVLVRVEQGTRREDRNATLSPQLVAQGQAGGIMLSGFGCCPVRTLSNPSRRARSLGPSMRPLRLLASRSMSVRTRCAAYVSGDIGGTVSLPACSSGMSTCTSSRFLLGHSRLNATALYVRGATKTVRAATSPLEKLQLLIEVNDAPGRSGCDRRSRSPISFVISRSGVRLCASAPEKCRRSAKNETLMCNGESRWRVWRRDEEPDRQLAERARCWRCGRVGRHLRNV